MGNQDVVLGMLTALGEEDLERARRFWRDDAVWHSGGSSNTVPYAGDYGPDDYMEVLAQAKSDYVDYRIQVDAVYELPPELVYFHLKSWAAAGPYGEMDGSGALMVYRVIGDKIVEGWGIPARHDRPA